MLSRVPLKDSSPLQFGSELLDPITPLMAVSGMLLVVFVCLAAVSERSNEGRSGNAEAAQFSPRQDERRQDERDAVSGREPPRPPLAFVEAGPDAISGATPRESGVADEALMIWHRRRSRARRRDRGFRTDTRVIKRRLFAVEAMEDATVGAEGTSCAVKAMDP